MESGFTKRKNYQINKGQNRADWPGEGVGTHGIGTVFTAVWKGTPSPAVSMKTCTDILILLEMGEVDLLKWIHLTWKPEFHGERDLMGEITLKNNSYEN